MSTSQSGNVTHDNKVNKQEAILQAALVPTASATTVRNAVIVFHTAAALSAIANGISPSPYMNALQAAGGSLYP